jgi:predicted transcriptional regulator
MRPREIQSLFPTPIKNPALRSYLTILVQKGHVSRRKDGKAFCYKAVTPQKSAFRETLRGLVDAYCGGSMQALLLNLIRSEKLTGEELIELERLAGDETTHEQLEHVADKTADTPRSTPQERRKRTR